MVTPGYFRTLEVPLLAGRDFTDADTAGSPRVIIIDATLARRFFADRDPLGHRIKLGGPDSTAPWMTIVGVAGEVKHYGLNQNIRPGFYLPHAQHPRAVLTLVVRTCGGRSSERRGDAAPRGPGDRSRPAGVATSAPCRRW